MKILHYFLGFPPYRTGGLTKFVTDLMEAQIDKGHDVMALWPGQMSALPHTVRIAGRKDVNGVRNYELLNPLPVSLDEGINDFRAYTAPCDASVYLAFLQEVRPDVIHFHTLMGLHKELVEAAGALAIRTVFTAHDYFGICPKVTLYRSGRPCTDDHACADCVQCNRHALSLQKVRLMQSPLYRGLKNSPVMRILRKQHRNAFFLTEENAEEPENAGASDRCSGEDYQRLRAYYKDMLQRMDVIHFNSELTAYVYQKYITPKSSRVITITHKNIADHRTANAWTPEDKLRITYLASTKPYKGFPVLQQALDALWNSGRRDFVLHVYSDVVNPSPYMVVENQGFHYEALSAIFAGTDVLVAPSLWYETFGFTVLEALSYGVPVIVSENVGAKCVMGQGGIVVPPGDAEALKDAIAGLDHSQQMKMRNYIKQNVSIKTCENMVQEINDLYQGN